MPSHLHAVPLHEGVRTSQCPELMAGAQSHSSISWSQGKSRRETAAVMGTKQSMLRASCSGSSPKQTGKKPKNVYFYALHMKWHRCFPTSTGFEICFPSLFSKAQRFPGLIQRVGRKPWLGRGCGWAALAAPSPQNILGALRGSCHQTRVSLVAQGTQGCSKEAECGSPSVQKRPKLPVW